MSVSEYFIEHIELLFMVRDSSKFVKIYFKSHFYIKVTCVLLMTLNAESNDEVVVHLQQLSQVYKSNRTTFCCLFSRL